MAAVMDPFDTQMVDFTGSDDVHMQASNETWFQDETLMEDDVQRLHGETQSNSTEYEDVEIEMDENYAENPEYEMIDEEVADYPVGDVREEEDIIVTDVSHDVGENYVSAAQFETPSQSTELSYASQNPSIQQEQSAASFDSANDQLVDQQEGHPTSLTDLVAPSTLPDVLQYPSSAEIPESNGAAEVYDYHEHGEQQEYHEEPQLHASVSVDAQIDGGRPEPLPQPSQVNEETRDNQSTDGVTISQDQSATSGQNIVGEQDSHQQILDSTSKAPQLDMAGGANNESLTLPQAESSNEVVTLHHEVENSSVEPPPGILMSLSSSDQTEIYLFNQPNYPESSTATVAAHSEILLFEHNPSLYYEPLSTLFDALRQEESVAHWCDLSNSELVIDAYDLQLVISEDNIFSRETSLYDLHQLHEGSGLSGPLRLRLQNVTARFIIRYRALQDQVYRLSLVTAANDYVEDQESTEHQEEEPVVSSEIKETEGITETYQEELTHSEHTGEGEGETENDFDEVHEQDQEGEQPHDEHDSSTLDGTLDEADEAEAPEENRDSNEEQRENEDEQQHENHPEDTQENTNGTASMQKNIPRDVVQEEHRQDDGSNENNDHEAQDYQEYPDENSEETTETDQGIDQDDTEDRPDEAHDGEYEEDQEADTLYNADGDAAADEHVGGSELEGNAEEKSDEHSEYADADANADDDDWDDTFEEDEGVNTTFEEEENEQESDIISSHIALSTKSSKRSIDEVESEDHEQESPALLDSPGSKRARVE